MKLIANHQVVDVHAIKKWALQWLVYILEDVEYKTLVVPYHVKEYWSLFVVEEDKMFHFDNLPGLHTKRTLAMHMRRNEASHVCCCKDGIQMTPNLAIIWTKPITMLHVYLKPTMGSVGMHVYAIYVYICNLKLQQLHWQQTS